MFNKETYIQRRNRLKKEIGKGILLFLGNNESGMNYTDNTYHFRQDSTFLYFFGSDYAGLSALIDIDEDREIIFGDELTIDDIVWMGTQPTIREKSASVGITATAPTAQLSDYLNKAVQQGRRIHYLPPYRGEHQVTLLRLLGIAPEAQVAGASTELIRAVVGQRNYKSAEEIREIEEAIMGGIVFKGKKDKPKEEEKVKTKAKKATYIRGQHGSGAAKMKADIRKKRASRHKK